MRSLMFLLFLNSFNFYASAIECSNFLDTEKKLIRLDNSLIRPEPQFKGVNDIAEQIKAIVVVEPTATFFNEINIIDINYDVLRDKIFFKVEFKAYFKNLTIILNKSGKFDFSENNQILGFILDPLFKIVPPAAMTPKETRDFDLWLIEFFKKSNLTDPRTEYAFSE